MSEQLRAAWRAVQETTRESLALQNEIQLELEDQAGSTTQLVEHLKEQGQYQDTLDAMREHRTSMEQARERWIATYVASWGTSHRKAKARLRHLTSRIEGSA